MSNPLISNFHKSCVCYLPGIQFSGPKFFSPYSCVRFWCAIRLQQLEFRNIYSRMPSTEELVVDSHMIGWAFHSDCQANLFSSVLLTEPTWEEMRKMGVGLWFSNPTDLRAKVHFGGAAFYFFCLWVGNE